MRTAPEHVETLRRPCPFFGNVRQGVRRDRACRARQAFTLPVDQMHARRPAQYGLFRPAAVAPILAKSGGEDSVGRRQGRLDARVAAQQQGKRARGLPAPGAECVFVRAAGGGQADFVARLVRLFGVPHQDDFGLGHRRSPLRRFRTVPVTWAYREKPVGFRMTAKVIGQSEGPESTVRRIRGCWIAVSPSARRTTARTRYADHAPARPSPSSIRSAAITTSRPKAIVNGSGAEAAKCVTSQWRCWLSRSYIATLTSSSSPSRPAPAAW